MRYTELLTFIASLPLVVWKLPGLRCTRQAKKSKKPRSKKAIESEIIPTPFFPDVASPEDSKSKPNGKTLEDFE